MLLLPRVAVDQKASIEADEAKVPWNGEGRGKEDEAGRWTGGTRTRTSSGRWALEGVIVEACLVAITWGMLVSGLVTQTQRMLHVLFFEGGWRGARQ